MQSPIVVFNTVKDGQDESGLLAVVATGLVLSACQTVRTSCYYCGSRTVSAAASGWHLLVSTMDGREGLPLSRHFAQMKPGGEGV